LKLIFAFTFTVIAVDKRRTYITGGDLELFSGEEMMIRTCALVGDVEVELGFNILRFLRHRELW